MRYISILILFLISSCGGEDGQHSILEDAISVSVDWVPLGADNAFYRPETFNDLNYDGSRIYRLLNTCNSSICYVTFWSSNEAYLIKAMEKGCSSYNFLNPSVNEIEILVIGTAPFQDKYNSALSNCTSFRFVALK